MTRGLITDSTARLTEADIAGLGIPVRVVDLTVRVGEEVRPDSRWDPDELCAAMRAGARATTSQPAVGEFVRACEDLAAGGVTEVVVLTMSGRLSGTAQAAREAADLSPIPAQVVDTLTVSAGMVGAARIVAATAGLGLAESAEVVRRWCARGTQVVFVPESLQFLSAGGRVGAAAALVGKTLKIVPILGLEVGSVVTRAKVRTRGKAVTKLAESVRHAVVDVAGTYGSQAVEIVLVHAEGSPEGANPVLEALRAELVGVGDSAPSMRVLSTVVTAHVGPGTVGAVVQALPNGTGAGFL